jgi:signal peptidase I
VNGFDHGELRSVITRIPIDWRRARRNAYDFAKTLIIAFIWRSSSWCRSRRHSSRAVLHGTDAAAARPGAGQQFLYRFRQPQHGDIIVLRYPRDPGLYITIVALPSDNVQIRDGRLLINDVSVQEVYINGTPTGDYGPETVPLDSFFVLGDNRNNSEDSRAFGFLKRDLVVGHAMLIYWPPTRIRLLRAQ